jgi:gliding motility-associated-like protein
VNDAPVITGQVALSTPQNTPITLNLDDLVVSDIDSDFPNGFSLNVLPGENYSISQNTITPATDYTGLLTVPMVVNDGEENSPEVEIEITVEAISIGVVIGDSAIANGSTVVFDEVLLGDFDARDLQINNSGTVALTILAIQIDNNDFSVRDELPAPIPSGESANIAIEFMPTSLGEQSATLTIVSENTTDFVINLSARGIEKAPKVEVFNVVTPLNDGKHDYLKVQNIEFYESNSVVIYNRWGQQVYAVNDYDNLDNNFKGISSKGDQLDSGTYYYVIDLSGSETVKGFFVLQR